MQIGPGSVVVVPLLLSALFLALAGGCWWALLRRWPRRSPPPPKTPPGWRLELGTATGRLGAGVAAWIPGAPVSLYAAAATQNILILGGIGSGKTTGLIEPLLEQLLRQRSGGLIFDIKGDFGARVAALSAAHGATLRVQGPGQQRFPLLHGLSPELGASFLKSALLLSGVQGGEGFWTESATELLRNTLGVLTVVPERYSLEGAYAYLFDPDQREQLDTLILERAPYLEGPALRRLRAYQRYHESVFAVFDDKVQAGIRASAAQILSPFSHPDLVDAFCGADEGPGIEQILQPEVWLIDLPLARWGLGAKVVYTLIKLRFFNLMQTRAPHAGPDTRTPVFFMCDEYQEVVSANRDGLSDVNFWDKSRSSGTVGIVSAQSVSSFYAALPERALADAILQNFRQKLCYRTEDPATLALITAILGRTLRAEDSLGQSRAGTRLGRAHYTRTRNRGRQEREVASARRIRTLGRFEALALLSVTGESRDDILKTRPLWQKGGRPEGPGVH